MSRSNNNDVALIEKRSPLTLDRLRTVLRYSPRTGSFKWLVAARGKRIDAAVGSIRKDGYIQIGVDGERYLAHRLACFYMTGEWPPVQADHRNGVRSDNRWKNIRPASFEVNAQNIRGPYKNNTSGYLGVCWCKLTGKWRAQIMANRKRHVLGRFSTPLEAHHAYLKAKRTLHEGCTI